ncbi:unnamed protein product [Medioppia subpectinata]|uniref:Dolichyl-diphosphooligosaccharide--protein glycosyltransferase subunit STT3A n=1 Tax=Medioppia subpectinata TaxID=1979941 RepID=A0A7R9KVZ3_9ACAR|nr:unnamed protein product [Medioppia subpectinata]CAG2109687.1 unnamed protein product [Medioppia subpectinata]
MTAINYKTRHFWSRLLSDDSKDRLLKTTVLLLAAILCKCCECCDQSSVNVMSSSTAFSCRLFSVLRFESVIHEFDPYFNYRTTRFLTEEGFYSFLNWFDDRAWYPLGRIIGGTIYPGLMVTSAALYHGLQYLNIPIDIRNVCVFLAPLFSSFTTIVTYLLTKELSDDASGLVAAAMISIVPGYISRSVAGSYDNEGIAIFCMLLTYYLWIKSVKSGSVYWSSLCSLAYFYMVSSWGGYVFLINLIPLHVLALIITGRFSHRIYIAYSTVRQFAGIFLTVIGKISPWTGRFYSLLDPSYAKNNIPIIASVSEHQPTSWSSFYFDLQLLVFLFPVGLYFCFSRLSDANIFIILYGVTSIYFAGVMVRLMLVLAPVMCILSGIGISQMLSRYCKQLDTTSSVGSSSLNTSAHNHNHSHSQPSLSTQSSDKKMRRHETNYVMRHEVASMFVLVTTGLLLAYTYHCIWVTSEAYSSPSIVLSARSHDGSRIIFDDFREAYYWLRQNTAEDAKVMSWWDYGYQITAMANRTILVDNNTWNNTHISRVGQAMASPEDKAYEIMRELDVNYVLVIFGGLTGYSSDDINKFLWMVRIGGSTDRGTHIKETDYYTTSGEFRVDREGSQTLLNCLMYKMSYYRFGSVYTEGGKPPGYDRVRGAEIGNKDFDLQVLEEAYTTEHWLVRIYKVKDLPNRGI